MRFTELRVLIKNFSILFQILLNWLDVQWHNREYWYLIQTNNIFMGYTKPWNFSLRGRSEYSFGSVEAIKKVEVPNSSVSCWFYIKNSFGEITVTLSLLVAFPFRTKLLDCGTSGVSRLVETRCIPHHFHEQLLSIPLLLYSYCAVTVIFDKEQSNDHIRTIFATHCHLF